MLRNTELAKQWTLRTLIVILNLGKNNKQAEKLKPICVI
jgi:hypothetical protein